MTTPSQLEPPNASLTRPLSGQGNPSFPEKPPKALTLSELGADNLNAFEFSHYRLGERIGGGGMGVVYRATHIHLGKSFAIKFIGNEANDNPEAALRFIEEFTAVGQLNHPNIISAVDAGSVEGISYYVTELLEGDDLSRWVARNGPLPIPTACEMIRQAAVGLAHAHSKGFIHRDVKPSNLFLESRGNIKVLDFGLVRSLHRETELTCAGQVMGTVDYLSPEQSEDCRRCTPASDIYSLGASLLFLLSGKPPFPSSDFPSVTSKLRAHLTAQPPWLTSADIPQPLRKLLQNMLAKSPKDRPQSCEEIALQLCRWANAEDLLAAPHRSSPRATPLHSAIDISRRMRQTVIALTSVALATTLLGATTLYFAQNTAPQPSSPAPSSAPSINASRSPVETPPAPEQAVAPNLPTVKPKTPTSARAIQVDTSANSFRLPEKSSRVSSSAGN